MRTNGMPNETTAFASSHRQKKAWLTVLAVLAVLVVFATVAALTMPASAMTAPATPETAATGETAAPKNDVLTQGNAAPSDTAQSDTVTEQAAAETAALPAAAQVPEGYTVQRTVRDEENGFAVTVYAPEGVIPEDAVLSAKLLQPDSEEYKQAGEQLAEQTNLLPADGTAALSLDSEDADGAETPAAGYAAVDIHFEDADRKEIEPAGEVYITIDAAGLLPEDVDPESVTVQHHAEDADAAETADSETPAVTVETVADTAPAEEGIEGTVAVTTPDAATETATEQATVTAPEGAPETEVQAAFAVDSFSTFTITWGSSGGYRPYITVHCVDEDGNEIGNNLNNIDRSNSITMSDIAPDISGYEYDHAVMAYSSDRLEYGIEFVRLRYSYSDHSWQYSLFSFNNNWDEISNNNVYLVYTQDSSTGDESHGITFVYVDEDDINDNVAISPRNAIKYSIVLIDTEGNEHYDLPDGSTVTPSVSFDGNTVNMTSTATYEQMGISVPGYTFDESYAFFYWEGNYKGDKNDVVLFHNFNAISNRYSNYDSYIGFTRSDAQGSDYYESTFGDEGEGYFAYNPTGTLRIVLHEVDQNTKFQAHFVDAYLQAENSQTIATTDMDTQWDSNEQHWYGTLETMPEGEPTREGYIFQGWYTAMDSDGNGTGNLVEEPEDDQTHYTTDKTYYARWIPEGASGGDAEPVTPDHSKYVKDNGDGTYDLSLDIKGEIDTSTEKLPVNVLYILDTSYSMIWNMDGTHASGDEGDEDLGRNSFERMKAAQDAIDALNEALSDEKFDPQFAMVSFDKEAITKNVWTTDSGFLFKAECSSDSDDFHSGTNYANALTEAKNLIASAPTDGDRADAQTIVIFISDGQPNWPREDGEQDLEYAQQQAEIVAATINCDQFYAIGVGQNQDGEYRANLQGVVDKVNANTKDLFVATESNALVEYFENLTASITSVDCTNVVVSDTLSKYAELTENAVFTITVTNADGQSVGQPLVVSQTEAVNGHDVTLSYTAPGETEQTEVKFNVKYAPADLVADNNGTFTLTFPEDYALEDGWTYTITTTIQPTETAKEEYQHNLENTANNGDGYAGNKGDLDTDAPGVENPTSSNMPGFDSNKDSNLTYVSAGKEQNEKYPDPVIQVQQTGNLTITKEVVGVEVNNKDYTFTISTQVAAVADKSYSNEDKSVTTTAFTETSEGSGTYTATVTISAKTVAGNNVDGSVTIVNLPVGTYTVTEDTSSVAIDGYTPAVPSYEENSGTENDGIITLEENETQTVAVTNTYTHNPVTINFRKVDSDNTSTPLSGAQFKLYYTETETNTNMYYTETGNSHWVANANSAKVFTSNIQGNIESLPALEVGRTYYLVETAAPAGYQMPESNVEIIVATTGHVTVKRGDNPLQTDDSEPVVYLITNSTGAELPETGGTGTTFLTFGGLLMMAAAVGGYALRRRRGKGAR